MNLGISSCMEAISIKVSSMLASHELVIAWAQCLIPIKGVFP